jgi:hypothetical protein
MTKFELNSEAQDETQEVKARIPKKVAEWFEKAAGSTSLPLAYGKAIEFAYRSANPRPRGNKKSKS